MELLESTGLPLYYIGIILAVTLLGVLISVVRMKKHGGYLKQYLQQNPDVAKVYLTSKTRIASEAVQVASVNGEAPVLFNEGTKGGFYAKPGVNVLEVDYTYTRPGVMYKNVTKSTGLVKQEIEVEPRRIYILGFDRKEEHFTFEELSPAEV